MLALPQNLKHAAETETHGKEQLSLILFIQHTLLMRQLSLPYLMLAMALNPA